MDWSWKAMRRMADRGTLLGQLELEQRGAGGVIFGGPGLFSVGVPVGAGLGLLAPRRGEDMQAMVGDVRRKRDAGKLAQISQDLGAEAGVAPSRH